MACTRHPSEEEREENLTAVDGLAAPESGLFHTFYQMLEMIPFPVRKRGNICATTTPHSDEIGTDPYTPLSIG